MRKVIAAINMSMDGFCDHTAGVADDALHQHYTELLHKGGVILYGRTTYQLMQYWQTLSENPLREKAMDDFAAAIDKIPKIVFSHTLKQTGWDTACLAKQALEAELAALKQQTGDDILVGSPSLIIQLLNLNLVDEFQLCVHPVVVGKGLALFEKIDEEKKFTLMNTKIFGSGAIVLYYKPIRG